VPHVSVAENVYIGALSRRAGRVFDRAARRRKVNADLARIGFDRMSSRSTSPPRRSPSTRWRRCSSSSGGCATRVSPSPNVSHRLAEIFQVADRVAVLRDGALVGVVDAADTDEGKVVRMMVGRDLSAMYAREHVATDRVVLSVTHVTTDDVHDISLQVRAGEVVALARLVGAGRSEFCRALAGDLPIRSGEVSVEGRRVRLRRPAHAINAGIVYAPEERKAQALLMSRSVRDNIVLAVLRRLRRLRFMRASAERNLAREYVARLRVRTPSIDQEVRKLSGGNQQKTVLARWLARKPKVLILDEPTRGIDVDAKAEI
jgi:L-arabinose transport system ATP-binding protein